MLEPNFSPFPEIRTERLLLRRLVKNDAPAVLLLRSDERVMQYIGRERAKTLEDAEKWVQVIQDALDRNEGITWALSFIEEPTVLAGTIGLWRLIKEHYRAEIGYMLHPDHWNKGITREAIAAVNHYGFGVMKLHSIEGRITPGNIASARVLEKNGFIREAYFKEDFFFEGKFTDTAVYSLLAK